MRELLLGAIVIEASRGGQADRPRTGERDAQQSRSPLRGSSSTSSLLPLTALPFISYGLCVFCCADGRGVHLGCPALQERPADLHQALLRHFAVRAAPSGAVLPAASGLFPFFSSSAASNVHCAVIFMSSVSEVLNL